MYEKCLLCGKKLKNPKSKMLGYGHNCYKKVVNARQKKSILSGVVHDRAAEKAGN